MSGEGQETAIALDDLDFATKKPTGQPDTDIAGSPLALPVKKVTPHEHAGALSSLHALDVEFGLDSYMGTAGKDQKEEDDEQYEEIGAEAERLFLHKHYCQFHRFHPGDSAEQRVKMQQRVFILQLLLQPLSAKELSYYQKRGEYPPHHLRGNVGVEDDFSEGSLKGNKQTEKVVRWACRRYFDLLRKSFGKNKDKLVQKLPVEVIHVAYRVVPILFNGDAQFRLFYDDGLLSIFQDCKNIATIVEELLIEDQHHATETANSIITAVEKITHFLLLPQVWMYGAPQDCFRIGLPISRDHLQKAYHQQKYPDLADDNYQLTQKYVKEGSRLPETPPAARDQDLNELVHRLTSTLLRNDDLLIEMVNINFNFFSELETLCEAKLTQGGELARLKNTEYSDAQSIRALAELPGYLLAHVKDMGEQINPLHQCTAPVVPEWIKKYDQTEDKKNDVTDTDSQMKLITHFLYFFDQGEANKMLQAMNKDRKQTDLNFLDIEAITKQHIYQYWDQHLASIANSAVGEPTNITFMGHIVTNREDALQAFMVFAKGGGKVTTIVLLHLLTLLSELHDIRSAAAPMEHWRNMVCADEVAEICHIESDSVENHPLEVDFHPAGNMDVIDVGLRMKGFYQFAGFTGANPRPTLKWVRDPAMPEEIDVTSEEPKKKEEDVTVITDSLAGQLQRLQNFRSRTWRIRGTFDYRGRSHELSFQIQPDALAQFRVKFVDVKINGNNTNVLEAEGVAITRNDSSKHEGKGNFDSPFFRICVVSSLPELQRATKGQHQPLKERADIIARALNYEARLNDEEVQMLTGTATSEDDVKRQRQIVAKTSQKEEEDTSIVRHHTSPEFKAQVLKKTTAKLRYELEHRYHLSEEGRKMIVDKSPTSPSVYIMANEEIESLEKELRVLNYQMEYMAVDDQSFYHKSRRLGELRKGIPLSFVYLEILGELEVTSFLSMAELLKNGSCRVIIRSSPISINLGRYGMQGQIHVTDRARESGLGSSIREYGYHVSVSDIALVVNRGVSDEVQHLIDKERELFDELDMKTTQTELKDRFNLRNREETVRSEFFRRCNWKEQLNALVMKASDSKTLFCVNLICSAPHFDAEVCKIIEGEAFGGENAGRMTFHLLTEPRDVVNLARDRLYRVDPTWTPRMKRRCVEKALGVRSKMVLFVTRNVEYTNVFLRPPMTEGGKFVKERMESVVLYAEKELPDQKVDEKILDLISNREAAREAAQLLWILGEPSEDGPVKRLIEEISGRHLEHSVVHMIQLQLRKFKKDKVNSDSLINVIVPFPFFVRYYPMCELVSQPKRIWLYLTMILKLPDVQMDLINSQFDHLHAPVIKMLPLESSEATKELRIDRYKTIKPDAKMDQRQFLLQQCSECAELPWEDLREQWKMGFPHTKESLLYLLTVYHEPLRLLIAIGPTFCFQTFQTLGTNRNATWLSDLKRRMCSQAAQLHLRSANDRENNCAAASVFSAIKWSLIISAYHYARSDQQQQDELLFDSESHPCSFDAYDLTAIVRPPLSVPIDMVAIKERGTSDNTVLKKLLEMDGDPRLYHNQVQVREFFCGQTNHGMTKHAASFIRESTSRNLQQVEAPSGMYKLGLCFTSLLIENASVTADTSNYLLSHPDVRCFLLRMHAEMHPNKEAATEDAKRTGGNWVTILSSLSLPALAYVIAQCRSRKTIEEIVHLLLDEQKPLICIEDGVAPPSSPLNPEIPKSGKSGKRASKRARVEEDLLHTATLGLIHKVQELRAYIPTAIDAACMMIAEVYSNSDDGEGDLAKFLQNYLHPDLLHFERDILTYKNNKGNFPGIFRTNCDNKHPLQCDLAHNRVLLARLVNLLLEKEVAEWCEQENGFEEAVQRFNELFQPREIELLLQKMAEHKGGGKLAICAIWVNQPLATLPIEITKGCADKLYTFFGKATVLTKRLYNIVRSNRSSASPVALAACRFQEQLNPHYYQKYLQLFPWEPCEAKHLFITAQESNQDVGTTYTISATIRPFLKSTLQLLSEKKISFMTPDKKSVEPAPKDPAECNYCLCAGVDCQTLKANLHSLRLLTPDDPSKVPVTIYLRLCIVLWFRCFGATIDWIIDLAKETSVQDELRKILKPRDGAQSVHYIFDRAKVNNTELIVKGTLPFIIDAHYRQRSTTTTLFDDSEESRTYRRAMFLSALPAETDESEVLKEKELDHVPVARHAAKRLFNKAWQRAEMQLTSEHDEEMLRMVHSFGLVARELYVQCSNDKKCREFIDTFCDELLEKMKAKDKGVDKSKESAQDQTHPLDPTVSEKVFTPTTATDATTAGTEADLQSQGSRVLATIIKHLIHCIGFTQNPAHFIISRICSKGMPCCKLVRKELIALISKKWVPTSILTDAEQVKQLKPVKLPASAVVRSAEKQEKLHPSLSLWLQTLTPAEGLGSEMEEEDTALSGPVVAPKAKVKANFFSCRGIESRTAPQSESRTAHFSSDVVNLLDHGGCVFDVSNLVKVILPSEPNVTTHDFFGEVKLNGGFDYYMVYDKEAKLIKFHPSNPTGEILRCFSDALTAWGFCLRAKYPATLLASGFFFVKGTDNNWVLHMNEFFPGPNEVPELGVQPVTASKGTLSPSKGMMWQIVGFYRLIGLGSTQIEVIEAAKFVVRVMCAAVFGEDPDTPVKLLSMLQKCSKFYHMAVSSYAIEISNAVEDLILHSCNKAQHYNAAEPVPIDRCVADVVEDMWKDINRTKILKDILDVMGLEESDKFEEGICFVCGSLINMKLVHEFASLVAVTRRDEIRRIFPTVKPNPVAQTVFCSDSGANMIHVQFPRWLQSYYNEKHTLKKVLQGKQHNALRIPDEMKPFIEPLELKSTDESPCILGNIDLEIGFGFSKFSAADSNMVNYCLTDRRIRRIKNGHYARHIFGFQFIDRNLLGSGFDAVVGSTIGYLYDARVLNIHGEMASKEGKSEDAPNASEELRMWWVAVLSSNLRPSLKRWFAHHCVFRSADFVPEADKLTYHEKITAYCLANRCPHEQRRKVMVSALQYDEFNIEDICKRQNHRYGVLAWPTIPRHQWLPHVSNEVDFDESMTNEQMFEEITKNFLPQTTHVILNRNFQPFHCHDILLKWICEYTEAWPWRFVILVNCRTHFNAPEIRDRIINKVVLQESDTTEKSTKQHFISVENQNDWERVRDAQFEQITDYNTVVSRCQRTTHVNWWDVQVRKAMTDARSAVVLIVTPPGTGKTYLVRNLQGQGCDWPIFRIDCSDSILSSEGMVDYLDRKLPYGSEGPAGSGTSKKNFCILVADEFHMLAETKKSDLCNWARSRLQWLKVVLIGNRRDDVDGSVISKFRKMIEPHLVLDLNGCLSIPTVVKQVALAGGGKDHNSRLCMHVVKCFYVSLRALFSDEAISFRLKEFVQETVKASSRHQLSVDALKSQVKDKLIRFGRFFPGYFVDQALNEIFSLGNHSRETQQTYIVNEFRRAMKADGKRLIVMASVMVPIMLELSPKVEGEVPDLDLSTTAAMADTVMSFSEFCSAVTAYKAHPVTRLTAWVLYICKCCNVSVSSQEENDIWTTMRTINITDQVKFPLIQEGDQKVTDIRSCDAVSEEGDYTDLVWIHQAIIHGHAIDWNLVGTTWSENFVSDPHGLEKILNEMTHNKELVLRQLNALNILFLLQNEVTETGHTTILRDTVVEKYPKDLVAKGCTVAESPWMFAAWRTIIDQPSCEGWEKDILGELHRLGKLLREKLQDSEEWRKKIEVNFPELIILQWISKFGGNLLIVTDFADERERLLQKLLFQTTSIHMKVADPVEHKNCIFEMIKSIWKGCLAQLLVVKSDATTVPGTSESHGLDLVTAFRIATTVGTVQDWPVYMKLFALTPQAPLHLKETELILPFLLYYMKDIQRKGITFDKQYLKPLLAAVLQTQEPGSLKNITFSPDGRQAKNSLQIMRELLAIDVDLTRQDLPLKERPGDVLRNFEYFMNEQTSAVEEIKLGSNGSTGIGLLLKQQWLRIREFDRVE